MAVTLYPEFILEPGKVFGFSDQTDYFNVVNFPDIDTSVDVPWLFRLSGPDGVVFYQNPGWDTDTFTSPDMTRNPLGSSVLISTIAIPTNDDGSVIPGSYTLEGKAQWTDTNTDTFIDTDTRTPDFDYSRPTMCINVTVDCVSPLFSVFDETNYDIGTVPPFGASGDPRTIKITFPSNAEGDPAPVETTDDSIQLNAGQFYNGIQQVDVTFNGTTTFGGTDTDDPLTYLVTDIYSYHEDASVDCQANCQRQCKIEELRDQMNAAETKNFTRFSELKSRYLLVTSLSQQYDDALRCNEGDIANDIGQQIDEILDCINCDCGCGDKSSGTPVSGSIVGGGGSGIAGITVSVDGTTITDANEIEIEYQSGLSGSIQETAPGKVLLQVQAEVNQADLDEMDLQKVTDNGSVTTNDITVGGSFSIKSPDLQPTARANAVFRDSTGAAMFVVGDVDTGVNTFRIQNNLEDSFITIRTFSGEQIRVNDDTDTVEFFSNRLTNISDPTAPQDATTRAWTEANTALNDILNRGSSSELEATISGLSIRDFDDDGPDVQAFVRFKDSTDSDIGLFGFLANTDQNITLRNFDGDVLLTRDNSATLRVGSLIGVIDSSPDFFLKDNNATSPATVTAYHKFLDNDDTELARLGLPGEAGNNLIVESLVGSVILRNVNGAEVILNDSDLLDVSGARIITVEDPVDAQDAVNLRTLEDTAGFKAVVSVRGAEIEAADVTTFSLLPDISPNIYRIKSAHIVSVDSNDTLGVDPFTVNLEVGNSTGAPVVAQRVLETTNIRDTSGDILQQQGWFFKVVDSGDPSFNSGEVVLSRTGSIGATLNTDFEVIINYDIITT